MAGSSRGPHKKRVKPQSRGPLPEKAPRGSSPALKDAYEALAATLTAAGLAGVADLELVLLTARRQVLMARLESEVDVLPSLTVTTRSGEKLHPLVAELRAVSQQVSGLLTQLMLSPRSRSSSRLSERGMKAMTEKAGSGLSKYTDPGE